VGAFDSSITATLGHARGRIRAAATFCRQPVESGLKVRIDRHNRGSHRFITDRLSRQPAGPDESSISTLLHGLLSRRQGRKDRCMGQSLASFTGFPDCGRKLFDGIMALADRLRVPLAAGVSGCPPADMRAPYLQAVAFTAVPLSAHINVAPDEFGADEHKDYCFLTILAQDSTGGLAVAFAGASWFSPRHSFNFIVNAGPPPRHSPEITSVRHPLRAAPLITSRHRAATRSRSSYDPDFYARF